METKIRGIAVYEYGPKKGVPIVFIHGFPFNHEMWKPQLDFFSKTRHLIAYDLRGHGKSEVGDGQYTLESYVDDLFAVLDGLNIKQAVICGLSMGGYVALRAAERGPERVAGLVLCDTKSEADGNEAKIKRAAGIAKVKKEGMAAFAADFVKGVLTEKNIQSKPEMVLGVIDLMVGNQPLGVAGALLALAARTDTTPALPKLTMPTLILVGENDKLTPPSASEAMKKLLPNATMEIIPAAAHLSNLENPTVFNAHLEAFLTKS